jgi:hypothetical protein
LTSCAVDIVVCGERREGHDGGRLC